MINLTNILKEIYDKNLIGSHRGEGGQHIVYQYGKDKIIKFGHYGKIDKNIKIFDKYPDIFPKVYDIEDDYIILEELDSSKSKNELYQIKSKLFNQSSEIPPFNPYIANLSQKSRIKGPNYYKSSVTELLYNNLEDNELIVQLKKELPNNLYNSLIKNYYPLLKKIKNLSWDSKIEKDINDENFGYTLKGNLKLLDI
jgi:hypothetical protein